MEIKRASDGKANLHIYREGDEYYRQKSPVFLKEFTNICFSPLPQPPDLQIFYCDITQPLSFEDNTFDAVNAYHVFEHLSPKEGEEFASEIYRILKPGGIFRISVPDLERIVRDYLDYLEKSLEDPSGRNIHRYQWAVQEMIDQATREYSGGLMLAMLQSGQFDKEFVKERYGDVFDSFFEQRAKNERKTASALPRKSLFQRLVSLTPEKIKRKWQFTIYEYQLRKKEREFKGDPRRTKEAVRWMYDRLSLRLLVEKIGFTHFSQKDFNLSDIPNWDKYDLDQSNYGGYAIDPSVYVECRKNLQGKR